MTHQIFLIIGKNRSFNLTKWSVENSSAFNFVARFPFLIEVRPRIVQQKNIELFFII